MKSILLVKTSSLGDVVHNLPVVGDIRSVYPDAAIDWVVEEAFAAIPRMHREVRNAIPVAVRRWRTQWLTRNAREEIRAFLQALRAQTYDAVIDTQGLVKSALIARAARGIRYGLDWASAREPLKFFYERTFNVPWTLHAVERNRSLAARALGYTASSRVEYGIHVPAMKFPWLLRERYAVLIHATSAGRKLWSEANWVEVGRHLLERGAVSVFPWGSADERSRSHRVAGQLRDAIVPPALPLSDVAALMSGAQAVIGVDTGLTHLAAALGVPTVGIYCATDPAATGIYGSPRAVNTGGRTGAPGADAVISALNRLAT